VQNKVFIVVQNKVFIDFYTFMRNF